MPGQPGPVYPPGQFSLWNRPSVRASWLGLAGSGTSEIEAEPGYSQLATSDPAADLTTTQTWAAIEDTGVWPPRAPRRGTSASHTDVNGFVTVRPGGDRGAARSASPPGPALAQQARSSAPAQQARSSAPAQQARPPAPAHPSAPPEPDAPREQASAAGTGTRGRPAPPWESGNPPASRDASRHGRRAAATTSKRGGRAANVGGRRTRRSHLALMALLMAPVVVLILIVAVYVYLHSRPPAVPHAAAPSRHTPSASPSPTLGSWSHIEARAVDPLPLSLNELFPAHFASGTSSGVLTVDKTETQCVRTVIGGALRAAVQKAGCTQALRASYLSVDRKLMATIGVLNLVDVPAAEHVGKATGATEFIRQLPAAHGPTHNLTSGTGLETAEVKGHYLILIWAEFADGHSPKGKKQRAELAKFSADLFAGTANVSLTSRMVTGNPQIP